MAPCPSAHTPARRLLRDEEAAERAHHQGLRDRRVVKIDEPTARSRARIVDDDIGRTVEAALYRREQGIDVGRLGGVAGDGDRSGFRNERAKLVDRAGGKADAHAGFAMEEAGKRCAQAGARADDQRALVVVSHVEPPLLAGAAAGLRTEASSPRML